MKKRHTCLGIVPAVLLASPLVAQDVHRDPWCEKHKNEEIRCLSDEDATEMLNAAARAGTAADTEKLVDVYITVMTMAFPAAGAALGALKGVMGMLGFFDKPDLVGLALKQMDQRLTSLEKKTHALQKTVVHLRDSVYGNQNYQQARRLLDYEREAGQFARILKDKPTDLRTQYQTAMALRDLARLLLDDPRLWQWHDLRIRSDGRGGVLANFEPARFRPLPTFDTYTAIVMTWVAAIEYNTRGNLSLIERDHKRDLLAHVQFLRVAPQWRDGQDPPNSAPEHVMSAVSCSTNLSNLYQDERGMCAYFTSCEDTMLHKKTSGAPMGEFRNANRVNERFAACTFPVGFDAAEVPERDLESKYGIEAMRQLADRLERLALNGHSRDTECFLSFDMRFYTNQYLYGLKPDGELLWYTHRITDDRTGNIQDRCYQEKRGIELTPSEWATRLEPVTGPGQKSIFNSNKLAPAGKTAPVAKSPSQVTASTPIQGEARHPALSPAAAPPAQSGGIGIGKKPVPANPAQPVRKIIHGLSGPTGMGAAWGGYQEIVPAGVSAGGASFYGLTADGVLKWHRHADYVYGKPEWQGPIDVRTGFNGFRKIIGAGDGVIYAVAPDGSLIWHRHRNVADPSAAPQWLGPTVVHTGWGRFTYIFSAGQGVIYAVEPDGRLLWYRHKGYENGAVEWEGPRLVGKNWSHFKRVFSPGDGHIYAMQPSGELLWYRHLGHAKGIAAWSGPTSIAADWSNFAQVFPLMWGTPRPPQIN